MKKLYIFCLCIFQLTAEEVLVEITSINPSILIDLHYTQSDNFTNHVIYPSCAKAYLLPIVVEKLDLVQHYLNKKGLGLKVWDAYRPVSAQWKFWEVFPDERYVSNPAKGGRHPRGTTVDVTLVDLKTGKELSMPTGFDDFSQKAHSDYKDLSKEQLKNRAILHEAMKRFGFTGITCEWWHFDIVNWRDYPVLTVDFEQLS